MSVSVDELTSEALSLLRDGQTQEGIERLRRAIELRPGRIEPWWYLAHQMAHSGRHEEALDCLEQILRLDPNGIEARLHLADRLVRLDEAETHYRAVLERQPSCRDASCGLEYVAWLRQGARPAKADTGGDAEGCDQTIARRKAENEQRAKEQFDRNARRMTALPPHLHIETTTRCNAACIMCSRGHYPYEPEDLQPEIFERLRAELFPTAVSVNLSGTGEPMLGGAFDRLHAEAVRCGARVHLVTNATALTMERLESFARRNTHLAVSIDGATGETFESIRRKVRFDRVIERLHLYKKLRDIYPEAGSILLINFVAMRRNVAELPAVVDLAADLGAAAVVVLHVEPHGLPEEIAAEHLSRCPDLANRMFDEAAERARRRGIVLQLPPRFSAETCAADGISNGGTRARRRLFPERRRFPQRCIHPWLSLYVTAGGQVYPCCGSRRVMGDLNRQSVAEIWNGGRYRRFRRRIHSFFPPVECRTCQLPPGINAGNPSPVLAREGMLVKLLYAAEEWARRFVRRLWNWRRRKVA